MNWYAYRFPGRQMIVRCKSERLITGATDESGFLIAPFDGDENLTVTIPDKGHLEMGVIPQDELEGGLYAFPEASTTCESHRAMVNEIIAEIEVGRLTKCVAARAIVCKGEVDLEATFTELCAKLPDAFVFCFHTAVTGTWIGATPEILVLRGGTTYVSHALAGTRPAGSKEEWDQKNIDEHNVVINYIGEQMQRLGLNPEVGPMETVEAGPVEHLRTFIRSVDNKEVAGGIRRVASALSPTPALSGLPRDRAIDIIKRREDFDRAYYGGYCGPVTPQGNGIMSVILRCMWVEKDRYCIFVGGGIMEESTPEAEWTETECKASTIIKNLRLNK